MMNTHLNGLQVWVAGLDRRAYALLVGLSLGLIGGVLGLSIVLVGIVYTFGAVIAVIGGLLIITNVQIALYTVVAVMLLIPFGTMPFKIGFTPTLLDVTIGAFLAVYLAQWMTGKRQTLRLSPVHMPLMLYVVWLLLAFALGLGHSSLQTNIVRQFAGMLMSLGMVYVIVDLMRDPAILRRLVFVIMVCMAVQALMAIGLWVLNDATAETILNRLGRLGYPVGGVIHYIESNPDLSERAIGTFIAPNSLGGALAISAVIVAPQVFARKPILRYRPVTFALLVLVTVALIISFSRASMLALAVGLGVIAVMRYRRFIPVLLLAGLLLLFLPQTQAYIDRFAQGFTGQDLATQMRIGEYTDSLRLIQRYPLFGVGFTGTPEIDIYTDVANMYLIMANQIGLMGVAIFLVTMSSVFVYGLMTWSRVLVDPELDAIHLGFHAALVTALVNAVADLYFFRLDFQPLITLFWMTVALALASSQLVRDRHANTPDQRDRVAAVT